MASFKWQTAKQDKQNQGSKEDSHRSRNNITESYESSDDGLSIMFPARDRMRTQGDAYTVTRYDLREAATWHSTLQFLSGNLAHNPHNTYASAKDKQATLSTARTVIEMSLTKISVIETHSYTDQMKTPAQTSLDGSSCFFDTSSWSVSDQRWSLAGQSCSDLVYLVE